MDSLEAQPWNPARQCAGTSRSGERCLRNAHPGTTVCILHGAGAPQVREAAKLRLLAMVEPIISVFEEVVAIWHSTRCDKCGKPTGDPMPVIRVGQLVLDRAGFHPSVTVEHAPPPHDEYSDLSEDEVIEQMQAKVDRIQMQLNLLRANRDMRLLPAADDGFVIPEDDELATPIHHSDVQFPLANETPDEGAHAISDMTKESSDE